MNDDKTISLPEFHLQQSDPLHAGVTMAVKAFSRIILDTLDEYATLDDRAGRVLEAFEKRYLIDFDHVLRSEIKFKAMKEDPAFQERLKKAQGK